MSRHDFSIKQLLFVVTLSILVVGIYGVDVPSTLEEFSSTTSARDLLTSGSTTRSDDHSTSGSTTASEESSSDEDSSSSSSTTAAVTNSNSDESDESNVHHPEEPKLPVDLLSEDILLDPNIVLARVARQLGPRYGNSGYNRYNDNGQRPLRRNDQWGTSNEQNDRYTRLPVYPVFPGRK